jgi:hypothetical protein
MVCRCRISSRLLPQQLIAFIPSMELHFIDLQLDLLEFHTLEFNSRVAESLANRLLDR